MKSPRDTTYIKALDFIPEMVFVLDSGNRIVECNRAVRDLMGYDGSGRMEKTLRDLVPPEQWEGCAQYLERQESVPNIQTRFRKQDGSFIDVKMDLRVVQENGKTSRFIIARDITEQKKKELEYLQFSNVIHYTINPIQITDASGVMVYVNPAFEQITGYTKEELIGQNPRILNSGKHSRQFWKNVWDEIRSGKVWVGEVENTRKDGSPFHSELVISPIENEDGEVVGFLGAHRDITEQKLLQRELIRSQKMESIGTLAAGIAHEVGNPLTSISSLVQVILRTTNDDFTREKLDLIKNQINRIARIIRDLVDFSRPSTYVVRPTDLNQLVREALSIVQYGKKVHDVEFIVNLDEHLPALEVVADQMSQVFINILMNAVDAVEGRSGTITVESAVRGNHVHIAISDTGRGIPPEDREKIFEPFFTTKEVGRGSGLGLWISYGIVKSFDGDILLDSTPGKGSTFTVVLPVKIH
jgi:PAS domain S-box-containing protein